MTDPISVSVDGPPVSAKITWEQVRGYLRAKGWIFGKRYDKAIEQWVLPPDKAYVSIGYDSCRDASAAIQNIAHRERRHPSDVLRDIVRVGREEATICGADAPPTEEELAAIEAMADAAMDESDDENECRKCRTTMGAPEPGDEPSALCNSCAHHAAATLGAAAKRFLATVRALREENARLKVDAGVRDVEAAFCGGYATDLRGELVTIRDLIGAHQTIPPEPTIDAVKRRLAERDAWRALADARDLECMCTMDTECDRCVQEAEAERKLAALRTSPNARSGPAP